MAGSNVPLLTLPAGTANVLAEEVGFPLHPEKTAALLPSLVPAQVPIGVVHYQHPEPGSRHFLLMCGVGVDASIVYHLNTRLKTYIGQGAYWLGSLEQLQRKFHPFQMRIDGETHEGTFALISKSRRYGGRLVIAPNAHLLSDHFEVVLFHGDSPLRYVGYIAQIATQTLGQFPDVSFHETDRVELISEEDRRVYIEVDGESTGRLPAVVETVHGALTLLLPEEYCRQRPVEDARPEPVSRASA
jgi:diacylglycerol kinase family enzyme